ncbi:Rab11 family-interacting protein 4 [Heterocephalus glaber]|uniref:Rab11 family-interacting protein 4 n=1 Tax=Heterocephalus glaber TaxID=10181 RepID=G5BEQ5_HETGA|nr:Rab11 family-interacting protein 4 [Heterocephalus glaber]
MVTPDLTHSTASLIGSEEQCEDYREADDADCAPSSPCPDHETRTNLELIEDLRKELEHLQMYKLGCERTGRGHSSSSGLGEFNARAREVELEHEVRRLKQENHKLRDQNDDLNGQILTLSLYEAKNLFATQTKAQALAAEIDTDSRGELMEALKEQEKINFRLRQYMDKIVLAIPETTLPFWRSNTEPS